MSITDWVQNQIEGAKDEIERRVMIKVHEMLAIDSLGRLRALDPENEKVRNALDIMQEGKTE